MLAFAVRRIAVSIPILLISSFIVFMLASLSGNPLSGLQTRNPPPPPETIALEDRAAAPRPPAARAVLDVAHRALPQATSARRSSRTSTSAPRSAGRFGVTLRLIAVAMLLALVLAVVVGVVSAVKQYSKIDYTVTFLGFLFLAMPSFWLAILLKQAGIDVQQRRSTSRSSTRSVPRRCR